MLIDANPVSQCHLIAGHGSGKPVYITPQAKPIYDELYKLAKRNNYWAQVTVKGIQDLAAGRLHMNNIFVHPGSLRRDGREEFVVVLPGCKVTAEKLDMDGYKLLYFKPDANYFELNSIGSKPVLLEVNKKDSRWETRELKKGFIKKCNNRMVVVTDSGHKSVSSASQISAFAATSTPFHGALYVEQEGFDMMYTPGDKRIGGLKNYQKAMRPLDIQDVNATALLLARAMDAANDQKGVVWVSEKGGAAVLAQALKIYADQGGKLEGHHLYMLDPTVASSDAVRQAHKLNMKLAREVTKVGLLNLVGSAGQAETILTRYRGRNDDYGLLKAGTDIVKQGLSVQGGIAAFATLGGLVATAGGVSLAGPAIPALLTFIAAVAGGTVGAVKATAEVTDLVAPDFYRKVKGKF